MLGISPIDVRLGVRMLVKTPALTIVSTVALAIAIAIVAGFHTATEFMVRPPALPVPDGDRVVAIWQVDTSTGERGVQTLGDMLTWDRELDTLEGVGGYRLQERAVTVDGITRFAHAAEITPSAFGMLRVPPTLGRPLVDGDTEPGGPAVVLIGFDFWQTAFDADPSAVGTTIRIGGDAHTIVGVMPDGFEFPQSEQIWTPIPISGTSLNPDQGPPIDFAVGRLAPGASLDEADVEIQVAAAALATEYPETHAQLRPRVARYSESFLESGEPGLITLMHAARAAIGIILLVVAVNVGALIYARNAARLGEIAIRMALGASRRRVVMQMFIEALVLGSLAAVAGLGILLWPIAQFGEIFDSFRAQGDGIPYWFEVHLGAKTLLLVAGLTLVSAILTGALPALKLTSRGVQTQLARLQQGSGGMKFGRTTTAIVVSQVALSVALLTVGGAQLQTFIKDWWSHDDGGPARSQALTADIDWDIDAAGGDSEDPREALARAEARRELGRRAVGELGAEGATFGRYQGVRFFVPDTPNFDPAPPGLRWTYMTSVDPGYFDVRGLKVLAGRAFREGDISDTAAPVAIVNEAFVRTMLPSGDPVGQRIRPFDPRTRQTSGEWLNVVGVAEDLPALEISQRGPTWTTRPTVFVPLEETASGVRMWIRARGEPERLIGPLQALAADIDPTMVVHRAQTLAESDRASLTLAGLYGLAVGFFVFAALLLSTTGVYAMMSFTATQRTREIGIRTALGAPARRVVSAIFSRAIMQLGIGTAFGLALGYLGADGPFALSGGLFAEGPGATIGAAILIVAMGLIACGRPMRRALSVPPTVALRSDD
jgi:putative ABC transport system permease protein